MDKSFPQKNSKLNIETNKQSISKNFSILVFVRVRPLLKNEFGKEIAVSCEDVIKFLSTANKNSNISRIKPLPLIQRVVLLSVNLMALLILIRLKFLFSQD